MRTIVYGNGKSRQKWNVNEKLDNVVTWGCNRIFNDAKVDNLVAIDYHVQHLIYESGYAHENKCWFSTWSKLPESVRDLQVHILQTDPPSYNIVENERGDRQLVVINGRDMNPHRGLYITWVDEHDMVEEIDFPKEWSAGTTAIHLACQQGAKELYIMGFDLSGHPVNNVYEKEQIMYLDWLPHQKLEYRNQQTNMIEKTLENGNRTDWLYQMKTVIQEFDNTEFIWVEPSINTVRLDYDNLTYDTYENIRRKICR